MSGNSRRSRWMLAGLINIAIGLAIALWPMDPPPAPPAAPPLAGTRMPVSGGQATPGPVTEPIGVPSYTHEIQASELQATVDGLTGPARIRVEGQPSAPLVLIEREQLLIELHGSTARSGGPALRLIRCRQVSIRGLDLELPAPVGALMEVLDCQDITLADLRLHASGGGSLVVKDVTGLTITGGQLSWTDAEPGSSPMLRAESSRRLRIRDTSCDGTTRPGWQLSEVTGVEAHDLSIRAGTQALTLTACSGSSWQRCWFESQSGRALTLGPGGDRHGLVDCRLSGAGLGVLVAEDCWGLSLERCRVIPTADRTVEVLADLAAVTDVTLTDTTLSGGAGIGLQLRDRSVVNAASLTIERCDTKGAGLAAGTELILGGESVIRQNRQVGIDATGARLVVSGNTRFERQRIGLRAERSVVRLSGTTFLAHRIACQLKGPSPEPVRMERCHVEDGETGVQVLDLALLHIEESEFTACRRAAIDAEGSCVELRRNRFTDNPGAPIISRRATIGPAGFEDDNLFSANGRPIEQY